MTTNCEVMVAIALNENGDVRVCEYNDTYLSKKAKFDEFLCNLKEDRYLWTYKIVKVKVPYPIQYEDMTKENKCTT